jgi:Mannosyl-glycoprotein endo-beta-N-acetylglucosaminidase
MHLRSRSSTISFLPATGRWATALLAVLVGSATLAAPAFAAPVGTSTTTPSTTTTAAPGTTTTTANSPATTTTAPVSSPTTTTAPPPTTVPGPPPTTVASGPPTTLVNPKDLTALLNGLNADLARMSAIQSFAQAKAAAAAAKPAGAAASVGGISPAATDPAMLGAAANELKANNFRDSAEFAVSSSRDRLHELAVAYYVHADVAGTTSAAGPTAGSRADRSVILALLLNVERHHYDRDRRQLADAKKLQSQARAHADQLVAARMAAIETLARQSAVDATTTTTSTTTPTGPGAPGSAPAPTTRGVPGYGTSGLTILGPSVLSADELTAWYGSTGHQPSLTVPLATLTALYQANGVTYGVRDDVAFAQSIIETAYFGFPGYGQVATADNNFAGIGACDSCHNGNGFPDAASGVAAQLQLLHNYASPVPLPGPLGLSVGPTGCCPTWMSLTGVWATASFYGFAILTLYKRMLEWALPRRASGAGL